MSKPDMNSIAKAAILLLLGVVTSPAWARSSDRNKPMDTEADHFDHSLNESRPTVLSGNVAIVQGTLDVRAARAEITQRNSEPVRVVLTGTPVRLKQQLDDGSPMSAVANQVDYDLKTEIVVMTGNVSLQQPRGTLSGQRVTYNMASGQVTSGGQGNGRVKMRLMPKGAAATPAAPPAPAKPAPGGG